jgi:hypothetical protein
MGGRITPSTLGPRLQLTCSRLLAGRRTCTVAERVHRHLQALLGAK